jgi:lysophospholipase L1-like esterase
MKLFLPALIGVVLAASLALPPPAYAQSWSMEHWIGTWGAGTLPPTAETQVFNDQTLRLVVHTSTGGNRVRIRLSNEMEATPLQIGEAHIAVRAGGADIGPGTDRQLTFGGSAAITLAPGAAALSDPVELNVAPLSDLAISLYLPGPARARTVRGSADQASYLSLRGNFTAAATLPTQRTISSWPFLTEVDVDSSGATLVVLGDSITDGARATPDTRNRWPDWLARRLQDARDPVPGTNGRLGVVNRGIGGKRQPAQALLSVRSALEHFDRDVRATAGVRFVILMLASDDIGNSPISAGQLIEAYRKLIARAHASGIAIFGATLTPFEGAGNYSLQKEAVRQELNSWIRNNGEFDAVIDFDGATRDPVQSSRLLPAYDSGDHLHPNDLGYQAMGNAVPLELFRQASGAR